MFDGVTPSTPVPIARFNLPALRVEPDPPVINMQLAAEGARLVEQIIARSRT